VRLVVKMGEEKREKKYYICLRCGHKFWSRAKKPQCGVCKSKRVMLYEDFLKLPEEGRNKLLGSFHVSKPKVKEGDSEGVKEISGEIEEESPKITGELPVEASDNRVKMGDEGKSPEENPPVRVSDEDDSGGLTPGEKVKSERVKPAPKPGFKPKKKPLKIGLPKLSWKAYAFVAGLAFVYYLYKVGWFDEMFRQLKRLGAVKDLPSEREEKPVVRSSPVLGKIEKNLGRG